jgi:hypothetical protein
MRLDRKTLADDARTIASIAFLFGAVMIYLGLRRYLKALHHLRALVTADLKDLSIFHFDYTRVVIAVNYLDNGFVRRGLGGTIARMLSVDWISSGLLFNLVSLVWLVAPLVIFIARLGGKVSSAAFLYLAGIIVFSPQTFLGWSAELARTDMLVAGFVAWAALATMFGRRGLGLSILLAGFLAHETAVIFGAPLLLVLNVEAFASGKLGRGVAIRLAAAFVGGLGIIVLSQALLSPPGPTIATYMFHASPPSYTTVWGADAGMYRDIAIYMMVSGMRGVETAICYNLDFNPQYYLTAGFCLAILVAYVFILVLQKHILAVFVAVFVPVIFMSLIANDTGRWLQLGVINAWLLAVFYQLYGPNERVPSFKAMVTGGLLFTGILAMGHTHFDYANELTHILTLKLGAPDPGDPADGHWMDKCDPGWRTFLSR